MNWPIRLIYCVVAIPLAICGAGSVSATIIDHGDYTTDTATMLDWLDLNVSGGSDLDADHPDHCPVRLQS